MYTGLSPSRRNSTEPGQIPEVSLFTNMQREAASIAAEALAELSSGGSVATSTLGSNSSVNSHDGDSDTGSASPSIEGRESEYYMGGNDCKQSHADQKRRNDPDKACNKMKNTNKFSIVSGTTKRSDDSVKPPKKRSYSTEEAPSKGVPTVVGGTSSVVKQMGNVQPVEAAATTTSTVHEHQLATESGQSTAASTGAGILTSTSNNDNNTKRKRRKRRAIMSDEERKQRRILANRKSARTSRERRKKLLAEKQAVAKELLDNNKALRQDNMNLHNEVRELANHARLLALSARSAVPGATMLGIGHHSSLERYTDQQQRVGLFPPQQQLFSSTLPVSTVLNSHRLSGGLVEGLMGHSAQLPSGQVLSTTSTISRAPAPFGSLPTRPDDHTSRAESGSDQGVRTYDRLPLRTGSVQSGNSTGGINRFLSAVERAQLTTMIPDQELIRLAAQAQTGAPSSTLGHGEKSPKRRRTTDAR